MLFEVITPATHERPGVVVFCTEHKSAIPDKRTLDSLKQSGYRFKIHGKFVDKEKLSTLIKEL